MPGAYFLVNIHSHSSAIVDFSSASCQETCLLAKFSAPNLELTNLVSAWNCEVGNDFEFVDDCHDLSFYTYFLRPMRRRGGGSSDPEISGINNLKLKTW